MITYLDDCGDPKFCAKCEQPECCKRLRPYGFPNAVKTNEANLLLKLMHRGEITFEGATWYVL